MTRLRLLVVASTATLLVGCVSSLLARKVVAPPNQSGIKALFTDSVIIQNAPTAFTEVWRVRAGPPAADIVVARIEPGDYAFEYDLKLSYPEGRAPHIDHFNAFWRPAKEVPPRAAPPRGTLLFLHGYLQDKRFLTPWAIRLAQEGYRCVVVDLRGHGESTGNTFPSARSSPPMCPRSSMISRAAAGMCRAWGCLACPTAPRWRCSRPAATRA